ncbi:hypothetical protein CEXT_702521 [Caerostris extrusa]|uniref:Uncharacterized protein n=1 Tax=Caerostris extrusa TaxID=172846 RepID=A0AAV4THT1_CAEEX|nr:hypothetical protein CEXT_702521 [Caerostris extrusa]
MGCHLNFSLSQIFATAALIGSRAFDFNLLFAPSKAAIEMVIPFERGRIARIGSTARLITKRLPECGVGKKKESNVRKCVARIRRLNPRKCLNSTVLHMKEEINKRNTKDLQAQFFEKKGGGGLQRTPPRSAEKEASVAGAAS